MTLLVFLLILTGAIFAISIVFASEIKATQDRDPAARNPLEVILFYPGLHAMISHRINHIFWRFKIPLLPRAFSQITRFLTGIEIHPGARIGKGLFIDHGMGVVVGETTVIGNNVALFQGVTLGGTGKETGKRHPTLGDNIVVGAGAKILGNIEIGSNSYVGANAVVIRSVPPNTTVVGVPGRVTKQDGKKIDVQMDHIHVLDPVMQNMKDLLRRIKTLEDQAKENQTTKDR